MTCAPSIARRSARRLGRRRRWRRRARPCACRARESPARPGARARGCCRGRERKPCAVPPDPFQQRDPEGGGLSGAGLAPAIRSWPARMGPNTAACTGVGLSYPRSAIPLRSSFREREVGEAPGGDVIAHVFLNAKKLACIAPHLPGIQMSSPKGKARTRKPGTASAPKRARAKPAAKASAKAASRDWPNPSPAEERGDERPEGTSSRKSSSPTRSRSTRGEDVGARDTTFPGR